ncbi:MAG: hypothetical protein DCC67_06745 [Planctomycetota bacterium]|nr:MAG: hypothetical protein DCC67_06745 [Planctomycetota bacterium]
MPATAVAPRGLFHEKGAAGDHESWLAATLEQTCGETDARTFRQKAPAAPRRANRLSRLQARITAEEMIAAIEERLPTRVQRLAIDEHDGVFTLHGVSNSYYAKQLAGHFAMRAMEARMLGRLVNEIEVRPTR